MNIVNFVAELELDYAWREDEIRMHYNIMGDLSEEDAYIFRRAALLMIYAHFEGHIKFCFEHFVNMLNSLAIACGDASFPLVASTLHDAFGDLVRGEKKSSIFRNSLPDDSKLHRLSRQSELIQRLDEINSSIINIPERVVDTDSNLKPVILKKILFEVGLDYTKFDHIEGKISRLLRLRNDIAHGGVEFKRGVHNYDYTRLRTMAQETMLEIRRILVFAIENAEYRRG